MTTKYRIRNDATTHDKMCRRDSIPQEVIPLLTNVPVTMAKGNQFVVRVVFHERRATFNVAADCVESISQS